MALPEENRSLRIAHGTRPNVAVPNALAGFWRASWRGCLSLLSRKVLKPVPSAASQLYADVGQRRQSSSASVTVQTGVGSGWVRVRRTAW